MSSDLREPLERRRAVARARHECERLDGERVALLELVASLEIDGEALAAELSAVRQVCGRLEEELGRRQARVGQLHEEASAARGRARLVRREAEHLRRESRRLFERAQSLRKARRTQRALVSSASTSASDLASAMERLDFIVESAEAEQG